MLSSGTVSANSTETSFFSNDEIINQIEVSLTEGYQEYYNIDHFDITLCDDGTYFVEMTATLKAQSVEELDYYQGDTYKHHLVCRIFELDWCSKLVQLYA